MLISGLNKTTLLDYPGRVAATVFTGGCNFRCPFCHNGGLVLSPLTQEHYTEEDILGFLKKRKHILSGVCITGGEPTIQQDLPDFIRKIKELGLAVKLDTNGSHPHMLEELIGKKQIDYVAMDIKNVPGKYQETTGLAEEGAYAEASDNAFPVKAVQQSVELLKNSGIPAQWRDGRLSLKLMEDSKVMHAAALLVNSGIGILRLEEQQMSLEDIFLELTGGKEVSL